MTVTPVSLARRVLNSRLFRLSIWYSISNAAVRALSFALVPVFAALMTPAEIGQTALTLAWANLFIIGATLYLFTAPERARADYDDQNYARFMSALTALGMLVSSGFMIVLLLLPEAWFEPFFGIPKHLVVLAAAFVPLFFPFRMLLARWQGESQARRYAQTLFIFEVITAVCSVAFIIIPQQLNPDFSGALGRIIAIMTVRGAYGLIALTRVFNGVIFARQYWVYGLTYVLPMVPHALASELLANYDRVIIAQYYSDRETGIYSILYQFGTVVALLAAASAAAFSPWYYRYMTDRKYAIVRAQIRRYLLGFTGLTTLLIAIGVPAARLILPAEYDAGTSIIPIVMASGYFILLHYFFLFIQSQERKTWFASVATLITAGVNIALNWLLIPRLGYLAAGWTTLVSYMLLFGLHIGVVRLWFKNDPVNDLRLMIALGGAITALAIFVSIVTV
jgi:O-antigen/teichoic acid export membrane protein